MCGNAQRALAREGADGTLSFYANGEPGKNWEDLCAGPHVPSTGKLKSFKLLFLAGAYWHGDQNSDPLTRVYGTCFADKEGLETYLKFLEEATKLAGLDYILNPGEGAFYGPKSLQTERRDEMLAFRHDRGQQRTPSASSLNSP